MTCNVPNVAMGTPQTVTFIAIDRCSGNGRHGITNTAAVTTTTAESNGSNNGSNIDSITVGAASVDLGVTLAVAPTTAAPGDTVTYTVTVTNPDTATDATNVVVTDALPVGLTAVTPPTTTTSGTATVASNTWTWTIPTVAKAAAPATPTVVTASFDAIVDPATNLTTITNTVTMTATQTDPTPANNTATVDLTISAETADLNVVTAVDDSKPNQGDTIQLYIQVSNSGPADATNIVVKDVLPTGLKYVSCLPTGCDQTGLRRQSSQQFSIPSVPAGSADQVVLSVLVQASQGTLQNSASVVSFDSDRPDGGQQQRLAEHHDRWRGEQSRRSHRQHRRDRRHRWHRRHDRVHRFHRRTADALVHAALLARPRRGRVVAQDASGIADRLDVRLRTVPKVTQGLLRVAPEKARPRVG